MFHRSRNRQGGNAALRHSPPLSRLIVFLTLTLSAVAAAQTWQQVLLDSFRVGSGEVLLSNGDGFGYAASPDTPPNASQRFYIQADLWFMGSTAGGGAFFVFGSSTDSLWAAGYSRSFHQILFGRVQRDSSGRARLQPLAAKLVEILNRHNKYVFRIIFLPEEGGIRTEVNGVPLAAEFPARITGLSLFGYAVEQARVKFAPLGFGQ